MAECTTNKQDLDIVELTVLRLLSEGYSLEVINKTLGFDITQAIEELVYKGFLNPDTTFKQA